MKTAKEYYTDVFEGIRLTSCGAAMLLALAVKCVAGKMKRTTSSSKLDSKSTGEDSNG